MAGSTWARRAATAGAVYGAGLAAAGALAVGVVVVEAQLARRTVGQPFGTAGPDADGVYGAGPGRLLAVGVIGDSSADGLGAQTPEQTPGAIVATGLAAVAGRRVRLVNRAVVGAGSRDLDAQVDRLLAAVPRPDVVVVMVGANDVTGRVRPADAARTLGEAVVRLRAAGAEVVVGTCPDLGAVEPVAQPLRSIARRWARDLAAAQTVAVVEAGGRSVSLGDLLGPEFTAAPEELFSADRFHPSPAGYARAAAALLPAVCTSLGLWPELPGSGRDERVLPVAEAAAAAAHEPGTEVEATSRDGDERGPAGRWARLRRRGGR
ncbi:SGNH/GDSL hydrolase family protein [uncultured Pseudokineococcus sp.]|uniref:SGNH/GDSL hydrolase family protein n=1 Tax=uncultured Pseudokineococcus sp. TaxID=1642928 RepID=UPI002610FC29|nr:SGNH/GDSL hydrolase family protein [uncultured Pseudokineococcus sp.]